jgi:hypothetical protein
MQNDEQKIKVKESGIPRFYGQNKLLSYYIALQPLGSFIHMAACRNSSKDTRQMILKLVLSKSLP